MFLQRSQRAIALPRSLASWSLAATSRSRRGGYGSNTFNNRRSFHYTPRLDVVTPVNLADIGEGIVECEVIQWFVAPGARVEQFSPLCEVQSDKASSEISSKYAGVVTRLYYEPGEMARVGKPFVDIDTEDVVEGASTYPAPGSGADATDVDAGRKGGGSSTNDRPATLLEQHKVSEPSDPTDATPTYALGHGSSETAVASGMDGSLKTIGGSSAMNSAGSAISSKLLGPKPGGGGHAASLATPAVRYLSKTHDVDISLIAGSGRGGRVLKEDVLRFIAAQRDSPSSDPPSTVMPTSAPSSHAAAAAVGVQTETPRPLTPTQTHMFRSMTRSLRIPHFLYADEVDFSELTELRARLNKVLAAQRQQQQQQQGALGSGVAGSAMELASVEKLSYLPFIIKAVSLALYQYPILNARVETNTSGSESSSNGENGNGKPMVVYRSLHNIGVAMDTPSGLVVPVIKDVGSRTVLGIAAELSRLQKAALAGKLAPADIAGGTITVSNIGNIGGTYVSPVIVEKEVAILGVGRMRTVPAFGGENGDELVRKQVCNFSWSADHRVVDGATMARAAEVVRRVVEEPDVMVLHLR